MLRFRLLVVTVVVTTAAVSSADIIDDFEDGDFTQNPTWTPGAFGSVEVATDPLRPGNMVVKTHGTEGAHSGLATPVNQSWTGFSVEMEFLADTTNFSPVLNVWTPGSYYIGVWLIGSGANGLGLPDGTRWLIADNPENTPGWLSRDPNAPVVPFEPINEWWRIRLFHNPADGLIHSDLHRVADNSLVSSRTYAPALPLPAGQIEMVGFGMEEVDWQYADNVRLSPEPTTALLSCLAGTVLLGRRRT